jgi:hypothetical protein
MIGFNGLPKVTTVRRRPAPAVAVARPPTIDADSIEVDEEDRRLMSAPLQPSPRPEPTYGPFNSPAKVPTFGERTMARILRTSEDIARRQRSEAHYIANRMPERLR